MGDFENKTPTPFKTVPPREKLEKLISAAHDFMSSDASQLGKMKVWDVVIVANACARMIRTVSRIDKFNERFSD